MHSDLTKWSDTDKALWILENGPADHAWIFERNGDIVYRRPIPGPTGKIAPWLPKEREEVTYKIIEEFQNEQRN